MAAGVRFIEELLGDLSRPCLAGGAVGDRGSRRSPGLSAGKAFWPADPIRTDPSHSPAQRLHRQLRTHNR
jgi:hypothetical protein